MEKFRHMTINEAHNIASLMQEANSSLMLDPYLALIDLKQSLLNEECYEMLDDLKRLEELNGCHLPFTVKV